MILSTKWPFYIKLACSLISILLLGWFALIGQTILIPLLIGFLISILLVPVCNFFENYIRLPRAIASIITTLLFSSVIVGIFYVIILQLVDLSNEWPMFQKQIMDLVTQTQEWIHRTFGINTHNQIEYINSNLSKTISASTVVIEHLVASIARYSVLILFTFLYVVFILMYRQHLVRFVFYVFKKNHHRNVSSVITTTQHMVKQYLIGLFFQMILVTGLTFAAFTIIGIKYAFVLAIITGLLNVIPYVGITISLIISSILTVATSSPSDVPFVFLAFFIIHAIDGNIIMPKIVGSKVKVNSLVVIIGLVIGEMTWGIMGMLLSIPILALVKIVFDHVDELKPWGYLLGEEKSEPLDHDIEAYFRKKKKRRLMHRKRVKE